ncbi:MAG TPA: MqnA/MqnD/SBP family protein, partial [Nitrososphaera sp.]|nr:MqnA/MqnD/SBP family protein [Nitrososphaera sp.]
GINVASLRSMTRDLIREFSDLFTESIVYGLDNIDAAIEYAMKYARGQPKETIKTFVKMYVNDYTLDMGVQGRKAIDMMFEMAREEGIFDRDVSVEVA